MLPSWWQFLILLMAVFRIFHLLCCDTILNRPREKLIRRAQHKVPGKYRKEVDIFIHCPWCLGWWISLAFAVCFEFWPHATLLFAFPWALSLAVALSVKFLDE